MSRRPTTNHDIGLANAALIHLYFSLKARMIPAKTRVIPLAATIGISRPNSPYTSHRNVPAVKTAYIDKDIPVVFFVLIVFKAWGIKDAVVRQAAARPKSVVMFMNLFL
jgi:hypothetical protein